MEAIKKEFYNINLKHKMTLNKDDFHQLINNLYQVEGTVEHIFLKDQSHIRYVCTNTDDIFNVVIPYFKNF